MPTQPNLKDFEHRFEQTLSADKVSEYGLGELYTEAVATKVWTQCDPKPKDAVEYFQVRWGTQIGPSELRLLGQLSNAMTQSVFEKYDVTNLEELFSYAGKIGKKVPADPGPFPVKIPKGDGKFVTKPFRHCTRAELRAARGGHSGNHGPSDNRVPLTGAKAKQIGYWQGDVDDAQESSDDAKVVGYSIDGVEYVDLVKVKYDDFENVCGALGSTETARGIRRRS